MYERWALSTLYRDTSETNRRLHVDDDTEKCHVSGITWPSGMWSTKRLVDVRRKSCFIDDSRSTPTSARLHPGGISVRVGTLWCRALVHGVKRVGTVTGRSTVDVWWEKNDIEIWRNLCALWNMRKIDSPGGGTITGQLQSGSIHTFARETVAPTCSCSLKFPTSWGFLGFSNTVWH